MQSGARHLRGDAFDRKHDHARVYVLSLPAGEGQTFVAVSFTQSIGVIAAFCPTSRGLLCHTCPQAYEHHKHKQQPGYNAPQGGGYGGPPAADVDEGESASRARLDLC